MKKILVVVFLFFFIFKSNAQNTFVLKVSIKNLKAPAKLTLTVRDLGDWKEFTKESTDGYFEINGSVQEPSFSFLVMKYLTESDRPPEANNVSELFIENRSITIVADGSLSNAEINGGVSQKELEQLKKEVKALQPNQLRERGDVVKDFVQQHPKSFVSIYALQDFAMDNSFNMEAEKVFPLFNSLSSQMKESISGKELARDIDLAQHTALGSLAPAFTQSDTLQRNISLKSFRGKYVLIDFWASWCKPCRAENPDLVKAFEFFKDKNFTILGISLDKNKTSWMKAIHKDGLAWTHLSDLKFWKNEVALLYGVKTIPQNFILDPNGKIIAKNVHSKDLMLWLTNEIH